MTVGTHNFPKEGTLLVVRSSRPRLMATAPDSEKETYDRITWLDRGDVAVFLEGSSNGYVRVLSSHGPGWMWVGHLEEA